MNELLLDTHTILWFLLGNRSLSTATRERIVEAERREVSIVSLWEIAIKINIGKLKLPADFETVFPVELESNGFDLLPLTLKHVARYVDLPLHHRDPFDRMLVAQAQVEGLTLVTRDKAMNAYDVPLLW